MASKPLEAGDPTHLGRFELLSRLGEGGQGIVYLGRGTGPGEEQVAVKVLRSSADATVLQRLARELDAIHQVQPFVTARIIDATVEGDRRFIVSEFIDGPSLQERVDAQGPLNEGNLQRLAVGTATALTAIHGAGVIHRDFKPANVLLGPDGPRVVDFGIARVTDASTITSGLIGTPSYVAPEQLAGQRPTSAVDVFAWALTMSFAATGRLAFTADTVQAVIYRILYEEPDVNGLPLSLLPVIQECLSKDPRQRPAARDILLRLVDPTAQRPVQPAPAPRAAPPAAVSDPGPSAYPIHVARTDPVTLTPGRTGPLTGPSIRHHRTPLAVGAGVVLAVIIGVAVALVLHSHHGPPATGAGVTATTAPSATTAATTPAAASGLTIPAAFAGTWTGAAVLSASGVGAPNTETFTFTAGQATAHEIDTTPLGNCANTLTLTAVTARELTFTEPAQGGCVAGTSTFTRQGAHLAFLWSGGGAQNAGTLHKS
jgi:predicted Ser/Thr protein kinase